jgi:hypothetical protein
MYLLTYSDIINIQIRNLKITKYYLYSIIQIFKIVSYK